MAQIYEYTPAMGDAKILIQKMRPTWKRNGCTYGPDGTYTIPAHGERTALPGWILGRFMDDRGGSAFFHISQCRLVSNHP